MPQPRGYGALVGRERWSLEQAGAWADAWGFRLGCNFTPSTAGNQLELWQPETFDPVTIDRELGWAAQTLGMNTVRVYLHDILHAQDAEGFLALIDTFLSVADSHGIAVVPVLFDGVWNTRPKAGPQPEPRPHLHNSVWVQSPGARILHDPSLWDGLRPYVTDVLTRFGDDRRVLAWDVFNEPDQADSDTLREGSRARKSESACGLLQRVFGWARDAGASQPLTAGVWEYDSNHAPVDSEFNRIALAMSDIVSFHCYMPEHALRAVVASLSVHGRPLLCTEWLARSEGSTASLLPVFRELGVGAINWGLVDGRTQTRFPWKSWTEPVGDDEPWFHELLRPDGSPYEEEEAALFRSVSPSRD